MNRAQWLTVVVGLFLGLSFSAAARTTHTSAAPAQGSAAKSSASPDAIENDETLHVTPDQIEKINSIREDAKKQVQEIEKDKTLTDDQRTRKIKRVAKETRAQVFAVLTPEQQKTWSDEQREKRLEKKAAK